MNDDLTAKVVAWATETALEAIKLPSSAARDALFARRHRELAQGAVAEGAGEDGARILADACVGAARRIMIELLVQRAGEPKGRA